MSYISVCIVLFANINPFGQANWPENGLEMAEVFFTSKNQGEMGLAAFDHWTPLVRNVANIKIYY